MNIGLQLEKLWVILSSPFRKTYVANVCGHTTKQKGFINDNNYKLIMKMPLMDSGSPDYCLKCIEDMSIKCAWCGKSILVGEPITLYSPKEDYEIPDYAVHHPEKDSEALVGCTRRECSMGADMCGVWVPPGKVNRMPSPIEICLATGKSVCVHDVSDYPNSMSVNG